MSKGVRWMFHATAMGPDYDAMLEPLARLFGCRALHCQAVDPPVGRFGGMTWIADNAIEIGAPYGEKSAVHGFLQRFGGGMHSVAVQVHDLDATLRRIEPLGVTVATRIDPEIVFTSPGGTAGLVVEWASNVQTDDPRWGAAEPVFVVEPVIAVEHMAFVAALVRDPVADAERLAQVLDTDVVQYGAEGADDVPNAALDLGDCMLALYPIPSTSERSRSIWGGAHDRPRCIALGLSVADLPTAEHLLADAGQHVLHRAGSGSVVLDAATLPFPVMLTDTLLDGDPRAARQSSRRATTPLASSASISQVL
jgi:hypothetical protein